MRPAAHDSRALYAVRLDRELERGDPKALERYQRAAELALRESEEWELELGRWIRPGDPLSARSFVSYQAEAIGGREAIDFEWRRMEKQLVDEWGCSRRSLVRQPASENLYRSGYDLVVSGRVATKEDKIQSFIDGLRLDNEEAAVIASAHVLVGLEASVLEHSWRVASNAYANPAMRSATQIAWYLADWMRHPRADAFREAAARERAASAVDTSGRFIRPDDQFRPEHLQPFTRGRR